MKEIKLEIDNKSTEISKKEIVDERMKKPFLECTPISETIKEDKKRKCVLLFSDKENMTPNSQV